MYCLCPILYFPIFNGKGDFLPIYFFKEKSVHKRPFSGKGGNIFFGPFCLFVPTVLSLFVSTVYNLESNKKVIMAR